MSPRRLRKLKIALSWLAVLAAGAAVGGLAQHQRRGQLLRDLVADARACAAAFDAAELRALAAGPADVGTAPYVAVKQRLRRLRAAHANARFVYLFRSVPGTPRVVFLADSAAAGASDESRPGDDYPEAPTSPGLQAILRTGEPATEGPLADAFGTWVTAYAQIGEARAPAALEPTRDVLGVDMDASDWNAQLWSAGLAGALLGWVLAGVPFLALMLVRRQGEQRDIIRNLSEAMEQSHSAIMIVDLDSRIEYANRGLCRLIGYERRELIGRRWRDFNPGQGSDAVLAELIATVRAGRPFEGEWTVRRKDGSTFPAGGIVTPVKHRDGSLACFVAVFDDVSETKRKETELREARDLAEAGDRAKGQFLATMSHEVRTPLNGIVGFTSLLLETPLSSEQREYVETIRMSTEALIHLTGDILDFARIESGKLKLEPLACDPRDCVEDALDLLAARAAEKKLELLHRVAPDVPAAILIDGGRLRQVLVNLVGNAVKFTPKGEIEVSVERVPPPFGTPPEECVLRFHVRDTGIGIAREHQPRLFKPFSQVDESTTRRYGGTGLGLAISRNLVLLLGGDISVTSEVGCGATFSFTVRAPVAAPDAPVRDLAGLRVGLVAVSAGLRRELAERLETWHAAVRQVAAPEDLGAAGCEVALVEVTEDFARELGARREPLEGLAAAKAIGLVPVSLDNELRNALRVHFRLLLNKPLHHEGLFAALAGASAELARPAPPVTAQPTHFGYRVLVAEDNAVNRRLIERVLATLGCASTVVENGRRVLEVLMARPGEHDLLLLDLHMPEMDGIAALQEMRAGRAGFPAQTLWVVALTADAREEQRARARAAGINDYVTKPVALADVEAALRRFRLERAAGTG